MKVTDAMIVAGGRGTRLAPLTDTCPKPLLPLVGVPFLAGQIRRLGGAGITRVLLVVGADTPPFEPLVTTMSTHGVTVTVVPEPTPLDTAGGVRRVISQANGPVVVCNGDILTDVDVQALVAAHVAAEAQATLSLIRVEDPSSFGVCVRDGSRIIDFVEKPAPGSLPGQDTVNAGTYILEPSALSEFPDGPLSFERTVFPGILAGGGRIEGVVWDGVWADLGTPDRYLTGHRLVLDGTMEWPSDDGLVDRGDGVHVHDTAYVHDDARLVGPVTVLAGTQIGAAAQLGPHVVVGAASRVAAGVRLSNSVLLDHAQVGSGTGLTASVIGRGAHVGPDLGSCVDIVVGDGVVVDASRDVTEGARLSR